MHCAVSTVVLLENTAAQPAGEVNECFHIDVRGGTIFCALLLPFAAAALTLAAAAIAIAIAVVAEIASFVPRALPCFIQ